MTIAAIKKMTSRLTKAQKVKLAGDLLKESLPALRATPSHDEIERRADEVLSGKVKMLTSAESKTRIDRLMSKIKATGRVPVSIFQSKTGQNRKA